MGWNIETEMSSRKFMSALAVATVTNAVPVVTDELGGCHHVVVVWKNEP